MFRASNYQLPPQAEHELSSVYTVNKYWSKCRVINCKRSSGIRLTESSGSSG